MFPMHGLVHIVKFRSYMRYNEAAAALTGGKTRFYARIGPVPAAFPARKGNAGRRINAAA